MTELPIPEAEATEIATGANFAAVVDLFGGPTEVLGLIERSLAAIEAGREGITLPGDEGEDSYALAIGKERFSFQIIGGALYSISVDRARSILEEMQQEQ